MKYLVMLLLIVMATGCGRSRYTFVEPKSCTITGSTISCPDGTSVELPKDGLDGIDGTDGQDGADGKDGVDGIDGVDAQPLEIVVPCAQQGNAANPNEVFIRFPDGSFVAYYKNLGLVELVEFQTYQTTDKFKCLFQIQNGAIVLL